ncbi:Ribonucleoside-diphosphate reductase large chain [Astathelohania contejeani]|uniref:Ribonucleoside-diphosphate reductase n=1 Tax=Astathelohania contejeani TaxID=164912 RepID=A0ABQ7HY38_9MICR|nr:Ribonucleoside-diphosphate reductase large chain [Thelohania contejeani]
MQVVKRDGSLEPISKDKIYRRIQMQLNNMPGTAITASAIVERVYSGLCDQITSSEIDEFIGEVCASMITKHPDYNTLASRIEVSKLHKSTENSFSKKIKYLQVKTQRIDKKVYEVVMKNADIIDAAIDYERDYKINYFGIKTLCKGYLMIYNNKVIERPQDMWMRVSLGIHKEDLKSAIQTYDLMSQKYFTHATPTLFNSGTFRPQMSSCFLLNLFEDSIEGIYETVRQAALISKTAGGLGINIHDVRCKGSTIESTGGGAAGIVPMLKVFDATGRYVCQGGNKRPGAITIFLEPWHGEIFDFLDLRKNTGKDEVRTRDLFLALWIPDLFMKRVEEGKKWSLFCPKTAPGLSDVWGENFEKLYEKYESEGKALRTVEARALWKAIIDTQIETGSPFMLYKDTCNRFSNQNNIGTIKGSNLCTEIIQYSGKDQIGVCNLASIALPMFIENGSFNFTKLREITKIITRNLDRVIDVTYYPLDQARNSNMLNRPIGIGVQGLADVFAELRYPFESAEARELNKAIFETIYFASLESSCELAKKYGTYPNYPGSMVSKGILHFDLYKIKPSERWNWDELREKIKHYGIRNSLLVAPMPTASTSQILGFNECFEPFTSNIYTRRTLAGEFQVVNKYLMRDLMKLGLWDQNMKNLLVEHDGSIQNIPVIPQEIKNLYKTVWEIKMKCVVDMAIDRAPFIDQSQSLNIFIASASRNQLGSLHFHAWRNGLKTGMYYFRTKPISAAIKFTVDKEAVKQTLKGMTTFCTMEEGCLSCGS